MGYKAGGSGSGTRASMYDCAGRLLYEGALPRG